MKFTGALAIVYKTLQAGAIPVELKVRDVETTGSNIVDGATTRSGWYYIKEDKVCGWSALLIFRDAQLVYARQLVDVFLIAEAQFVLGLPDSVKTGTQRSKFGRTMNVNQEGYDRRIARIGQTLKGIGLETAEVTPIAYFEACPFPFNNSIYRVTVTTLILPGTFPEQPCTSSVPSEGITTFVVRFSNPFAEGLNNANRLQNEVAASYLVKESAEAGGLHDIVPSIYAWAPYRHSNSEEGLGWIMVESKSGTDLDQSFKFGGLTLDSGGRIVSGRMALVRGDPFNSLSELWAARLRAQLADADESSFLQGWKAAGLRGRLDQYIASGQIEKTLEGLDITQRILVHGDFTMNNMLYDPSTERITALLDFDWASVSHPSEEYFSGLWDVFGGINERNAGFRAQILAGTFSDHRRSEGLSEEGVGQWEVAKSWSAASTSRDLIRPSTIPGIDRLMAMEQLEGLICPFQLDNEFMHNRMTEDKWEKRRAENELKIISWLENWGSA
ncbi:hypothetical protein V8F33_008242 [Rhypophila sp. PSN 637]